MIYDEELQKHMKEVAELMMCERKREMKTYKRKIIDLGRLPVAAIDILMERFAIEIETPEDEWLQVEDNELFGDGYLSRSEERILRRERRGIEGPFICRFVEENDE